MPSSRFLSSSLRFLFLFIFLNGRTSFSSVFFSLLHSLCLTRGEAVVVVVVIVVIPLSFSHRSILVDLLTSTQKQTR